MSAVSDGPDHLYSMHTFSHLTASPCGTRLAFIERFAADDGATKPSARLRVLSLPGHPPLDAAFEDFEAPTYHWDPSDGSILFLRAGRIHSLSLADGSESERYVSNGEIVRFLPSPCGKRLAIVEASSEEAVVDDMSGGRVGVLGRRLYRLLVVEPGQHPVREVEIASGDIAMESLRWCPGGTELAYLRMDAAFRDNTLVETNGEIRRYLFDEEREVAAATAAYIYSFNYAEDGDALVVLANDRAYSTCTKNELFVVDTRTSEATCRSSRLDVHLGNFGLTDTQGVVPADVRKPHGQADVITCATVGGRVRLVKVAETGELTCLTDEAVDVAEFACWPTADGFGFAVIGRTENNPGEVYVGHGGALERLTHCNRFAEQAYPVEKVVEGFAASLWAPAGRQQYFLFHSPASEASKAPLAIVIHGGPHAAATSSYSYLVDRMVNAGFCVMFANLIGSIGWGQGYAASALGAVGSRDMDDLWLLVDHLAAHYPWIDGENAFLMGGSYGGFVTNLAICRSDRFRAVVAERSISDWISFAETSDIGERYVASQVGASTNAAALREVSPIHLADRVATPILILHGDADRRCPLPQATRFHAALRDLGKAAEMHVFEGVGHDYVHSLALPLQVERMDRIIAWLTRHLREPE